MFIDSVKEILYSIWSLIKLVIIVLIIVLPFKYLVAEPYMVIGESMQPNFYTGDYLIINKMTSISEPERGDVVVLIPPFEYRDVGWKKYINFIDPRQKFIKRIIGLPGDEIKIDGEQVFIKNEKTGGEFKRLEESFIKFKNVPSKVDLKLGKNEYFVLGDNRSHSYDSEEFGPVTKDEIIGYPVLRLFPFNKIEINPEKHRFNI